MSAPSEQSGRRKQHLNQIVSEHTTGLSDARTIAQVRGREPVSRYATVTLEGGRESGGNLQVADSSDELCELIAKEVAEGWAPRGRVWDLDADWDPWGNLEIVYRVALRPTRNF